MTDEEFVEWMGIESDWKKGKPRYTDWEILQDITNPEEFLRESLSSATDKGKVARLIKRFDNDGGRFSDTDLESARSYPIESLLGTRSRRSGSKLLASCPFHQERTASMVIYSDNSFHCFGCSAHGKNAVDLIMLRDSVSFRDAVNYLLTK